MKSPFRRRRRRLKGRLAAVKPRSAEPKPVEKHEPVDWPADGTGRTSMMGSIRGDGETGAGFGAGMFEDLHAAFSGSKKIQLEEQEAQKLRRGDDHHVEGEPRDNLDTGKIRIKRADSGGLADEDLRDDLPDDRSGNLSDDGVAGPPNGPANGSADGSAGLGDRKAKGESGQE